MLRAAFRRIDPLAFTAWAGVWTLTNARMFYGYMLKQTGGEWSAPLDDVFIHFDYARSTAQGHPFEWTVGNGYSSGNTSLTYPFVLAAGWLAGFRDLSLMRWAAIVACVCVLGLLLAARTWIVDRRDDDLGRLSAYLLPPVVLGIGALDWSLWSGMEVAFFLATWALAAVAFRALEREHVHKRVATRAWVLGGAGALMVTTRPEAALTIAVLGGFAALAHASRGRALGILVRVGAPSALCLAAQAVANRAFSGEWSANGAIVKLAANHPYMTREEKVDDYLFNFKYAVLRNLDYHFARGDSELGMRYLPDDFPHDHWLWKATHAGVGFGLVLLGLALLPLAFPQTRRLGVLLWLHVLGWIAMVAFNGQVRWQNERYVMPAVAWFLVLVVLGVKGAAGTGAARVTARRPDRDTRVYTWIFLAVAGALVAQVLGVLTRPPGTPPEFRLSWSFVLAVGGAGALALSSRYARFVVVPVALVVAWDHQAPCMRDQKWFFGRASRNIRDQHLTLGRWLKELGPKRVLVGDAGAILYEADRPGLDIIGLGGYHTLPFARAGTHGLPATLELIERIPPSQRPDVLAIFPTWWGVLPVWFSKDVLRRFPVEGNVICGGYEHVVYEADWSVLGGGERPRQLPYKKARVIAEIDVADLVSEKAHRYEFTRPRNGFTEMRVLPDPADPTRDLFDAGRRIALGKSERFHVDGAVLGRVAYLIVRTMPEGPGKVRVRVDGREVTVLELERHEGWVEKTIELPADFVRGSFDVELANDGPTDFVDYHAWIVQ